MCQDNIPALANYVNAAQRRLLYAKEAGDDGWFGTWAEIAFTVSQAMPYITLPREVARLQHVAVCRCPVSIQNQLYEYLQFGNGRMPRECSANVSTPLEVLSRNQVPTSRDLTDAPQYIRIYTSNSSDYGKRVLLQGYDANGNVIYQQDPVVQVRGEFVTLESPFTTSSNLFNSITGIQKDVTLGDITIYQVDPDTGDEVLLLKMQPTEQTGWYRRYYLSGLPCYCASDTTPPGSACETLQVHAIAKMELIPVMADTDYLLLQNLEAITEECQSIRFSEIDSKNAKEMAVERHLQAIRMLMGELGHYYGIDAPAVNYRPFGSARLENVHIGMI